MYFKSSLCAMIDLGLVIDHRSALMTLCDSRIWPMQGDRLRFDTEQNKLFCRHSIGCQSPCKWQLLVTLPIRRTCGFNQSLWIIHRLCFNRYQTHATTRQSCEITWLSTRLSVSSRWRRVYPGNGMPLIIYKTVTYIHDISLLVYIKWSKILCNIMANAAPVVMGRKYPVSEPALVRKCMLVNYKHS